jgi:hypothetical protein
MRRYLFAHEEDDLNNPGLRRRAEVKDDFEESSRGWVRVTLWPYTRFRMRQGYRIEQPLYSKIMQWGTEENKRELEAYVQTQPGGGFGGKVNSTGTELTEEVQTGGDETDLAKEGASGVQVPLNPDYVEPVAVPMVSEMEMEMNGDGVVEEVEQENNKGNPLQNSSTEKPLEFGALESIEDKIYYHYEYREIRKDINPFEPLTEEQKEKYNYSEAVAAFQKTHRIGIDITQKTFDQWVLRNLHDGWKPGDYGYYYKMQPWEAGVEDNLLVIDAYGPEEAFGYVAKKYGKGISYYFRKRISGILNKRIIVYASSGILGKEASYKQALKYGFFGSVDDFERYYNNSFDLYLATLISIYSKETVSEYELAINDGFIGSISAFVRLFEGKFLIYQKNKPLLEQLSDGFNKKEYNQRLFNASLSGDDSYIVSQFKTEVKNLATARLKNNIIRIKQWQQYVHDIANGTLYEATKVGVYQGFKQEALQHNKYDLFDKWLVEPNPNIRNVYEKYFIGVYNGGGQFCHSMNNALCSPEKKTDTPLQQLNNLKKDEKAPYTVWDHRQAPADTLSKAEIDNLRIYLNTLNEKPAVGKSKPTTHDSTTSAYSNIQQADLVVSQLNIVLTILGPAGYNVLPIDVFTIQNQSGDEMRKHITEAIDGRIIDYNNLIADIASDKIKYYELDVVTQDLLSNTENEQNKKIILDDISDRQQEESVTQAGKAIGSILALIFLRVPPVAVMAFWAVEGLMLIDRGLTIAQGEGALDVMSPAMVRAGKQMAMDGLFVLMSVVFDAVTSLANISARSKLPRTSQSSQFKTYDVLGSSVAETDLASASAVPASSSKRYIIREVSESEYIIYQSGITNQYARVTRNKTLQVDVFEIWEQTPNSGTWRLAEIRQKPYGNVPANSSAVAPVNTATKSSNYYTAQQLFVTRQLSISKIDLTHILKGEVRIQKIDSRNPKNVVDKYSYVPGDNYLAQIPEKGFSYRVVVGGAHHERHINGVDIMIDKYTSSFTLHTGEKVRNAIINIWVKELGRMMEKEDETTLFPIGWSDEFIEQKIIEASKNVIFTKGRRHRGITIEGYFIEFYSDPTNTLIETAYLIEKL